MVYMRECWRQSFDFESEVHSNDSASNSVVCVIYKGVHVSNEEQSELFLN